MAAKFYEICVMGVAYMAFGELMAKISLSRKCIPRKSLTRKCLSRKCTKSKFIYKMYT